MTVMNEAEPAEMVVLRAALMRARMALQADNATVAIPDHEPGYVRTVASAREQTAELWHSRFALRDGVAGEAAATRQVIILDDASHSPRFRRLGERSIQSILAAPIQDGERVRGILTVTSERAGAFTMASVDALADSLPLLDAALALAERAAWGTYLAGLAHDISTPVSSARGFLQLLSVGPARLAPSQLAEYIQLAAIAIDQLVHLGGDMHDALSMSRQNLRLDVRSFDAVAVLEDTLATFGPLAVEAGVQVRVDAARDLPSVQGDRHRVGRILSNLVQNAVKYTPAGRSIYVRADHVGARAVRLTVDDEGPGIAETDLPHLFDLNYQSASGNARGRPGHGLGLAIARALARAHGGDLTAGNRPAGGARFVLTLPTQAPTPRVEGGDPCRAEASFAAGEKRSPEPSDEFERLATFA